MSWTIRSATPTLAVPDLELGVEVYRRLGFVERWRFPGQAATHVGLGRGECELILCACEPAERAEVLFRVDDVDACHREVLAGRVWELAAQVAGPATAPRRALAPPPVPEAKPWGRREFSVVDPWGHLLSFGQEG